jgi:predicted NBD/HSP70 family sugar kinase
VTTTRRSGTGTNQEAVRRQNLGTLLRHVHQTGESTRAELTNRMGLNRSTIGGLVAELGDLGLTEHGDAVARRGAGRPSPAVRIAPDGPYVLAVDLGVDRAVVARVGLGGQIWARGEAALGESSEVWQIGATVAGLLRQVAALAPRAAPLLGIGIGVPGLVRRSDGLVRHAPNLGWRDVSFGSVVLAALGVDVPVSIANDADLGALSEHNRGSAVGVDDLVYISGNVGVGAGVILGGARIEGAGGYAGEVGHLGFDPDGPLCHCGNRGCWETFVGAHAIAESIGRGADQVPRLDAVLDALESPPTDLRPVAVDIGRGLAAVANAYNPEVVVLGGYFRPMLQMLRPEMESGLAERALAPPLESVRLTLPGLGADSTLLGAAEMALSPVFADPVACLAAAVTDAGARLAG